MAIIYSYPEIPEVEGGDLLLISDTGAPNKPTRSVDIDDLAAYIGTVVGVVQNLQSVLTVGNTYVNANGYGTFTLNDTANDDGSITFVNPNEGWGYQISAEEGFNITNGSGTNLMSIYSSGLSIRNGAQMMNIGTNALTATRNVYFPDASGTIALTSDIPSPGPSGSGTTNYTARWTSASALGIGALYDNGADVGIGINGTYTDPPQRLTVVSDDDIQPVAQFKNIGNGGGLFVRTDSTTRPLLELFSGSSYRFVVKGTGDVGIGTTSPSEKLEVNGNITVADEGEIYIQGSTSARKIVRLDNTNDKGLITLDRGDATRVSISSDLSTHGHTYFNGLNVNIGIGTTSPSTKLHVNGDIRQQGSSYSVNITGGTSINGDNHLDIAANGSYLNLRSPNNSIFYRASSDHAFRDAGGSNEYLRIKTSGTTAGNVGIGTTSPDSLLEISTTDGTKNFVKLTSGAGGVNPTLVFEKSAVEQGVIQYIRNGDLKIYNTDSDGGVMLSGSSATNYDMYINNSGNVGIGTTSPSEKLEVAGQYGNTTLNGHVLAFTRASANYLWAKTSGGDLRFTVNGNAIGSPSMTLSTAGNLGIGTTSPAYRLSTQVASNDTYAYYVANSSGSNRGGIYVDSNGHTRFLGRTGAGTTVQISASGTSYLNGGNVGIGTTSPSSKFQVSANDGDGITLKHGTSNAFYILRDGNDDTIIKQTRNYTSKISISTLADSGTHESSGLNIVGQGSGLKSNVGIGTANPTQKLHVIGVGSFGTSTSQTLVDYDGLNAVGNTDYIRFKVDNSEKLRIKSNGNVGVGTTSPSAKLEVSSTSGWGLFTERGIKDGSTSTYSHSYGAGNAHILGRSTIFESSVTFSTLTASSTTKEYRLMNQSDKLVVASVVAGLTTDDNILVVSGTNVGIGITSPSEKLELIGYAKASTGFKAGNYTILNESGNETSLGNSAYYPMFFKTNNSVRMTISNSGNVGIGTTSPNAKLNVNGNIKIEGTNALLFGGSSSVPSWEIKHDGSDLIINDTGTNVGSVLFNNDEGVVLPRLTTTEINAISLPSTGLTVYNTTLNTLCFYNGSSWQKVSHANM